MRPVDTDLDALLKRLHLANTRRVWRQLVEQAEKEEWSYRDFLSLLVLEEITHRQQTRLGRLSRRAAFERGLEEHAIGAEYIAHYLKTPQTTPGPRPTQTELPL